MFGVVCDRVADQFRQVNTPLNRTVDFKVKRRRRTNGKSLGQLHTQKSRRAVQPIATRFSLCRIAELGKENFRVRVIAR
jgi:hypothetical protein